MPKRVHGKRALLNLPGSQSIAAIVAEVENTSQWKKGYGRDDKKLTGDSGTWSVSPDTVVKISDCDRSISLEFAVEGEENQFKNTLHKVDTMIDTLVAFKAGLLVERERFLERMELVKKLNLAKANESKEKATNVEVGNPESESEPFEGY